MLGNALLPIDEYPRDYYATDDWTDTAIGFVREHARFTGRCRAESHRGASGQTWPGRLPHFALSFRSSYGADHG
jgi:hypothetical protein